MNTQQLEKELSLYRLKVKHLESKTAWFESIFRKFSLIAGTLFISIALNYAFKTSEPMYLGIISAVSLITILLITPLFKRLWEQYVTK